MKAAIFSSFLLSATTGLLFSSKSIAANYYVDNANPQAADSNPGSEAAPWATIQHAVNSVAGGDTVTVKAGTYPERIVVSKGGTADAKITLLGVPSRSAMTYGFNIIGAPYVHVEGFDITNSPQFAGWDETEGVFIQSDYVEVVDNYFHDMSGTGIVGYWHEPFPNYAYVAKNRMYRMQMGITNQGTGWVIEDNEVERLFMFPGGGDCDYSRLFGDGHVVRRNYFHGTDFSEIGSAHVDCFQTFDNNGEHLRDVLIDGNTCFDFHQAFMGEASFHRASSHVVFSNNLFAHGGAWGLCVMQITDVEAYNNTFYDIAYHGAGFRDGATGIVKNNIFMNVETSYWASDGGQVTGDSNIIMTANPPDPVGAHDLVATDPLFVDVANNDFHLTAESPAIDKGEALPDVTADHDGIARPQGSGWDIGAFEYCAGSCPAAGDAGWGPFPPYDEPSATSASKGGCTCSASPEHRSTSYAWAALATAVALALRRRRR
jgi:MYXO-CTERM domain-containing protein